jgi:hypothetical protein
VDEPSTSTTPSAEELAGYLDGFARRYREERRFRELVHDFLGLSPLERLQLSAGALLDTAAHQRRTAALIRRFAERVRPAAAEARELAREQAALERAEEDLARRSLALAVQATAPAEAIAPPLPHAAAVWSIVATHLPLALQQPAQLPHPPSGPTRASPASTASTASTALPSLVRSAARPKSRAPSRPALGAVSR